MFKSCLVDVKGTDDREISKNSAVNIRNMVELSNALEVDFFYNAQQLARNKNKYDVIIFGFGSVSSNINETREFAKKAGIKKIIWLVTEYEQTMHPAMYYVCKDLGLKYNVIKNFTHQMSDSKLLGEQMTLNLNLLIHKTPNKLVEKKYDCVYYSRWRPNREKYLKEYLQKGLYFSSDVKNFKQHKHIGCNPKYIKKLSWQKNKEELNLFRYSLYIEDEYTHTHFNNLANRWYEAGICNNVVFFDINCKNTIEKSEISEYMSEISRYFVSSLTELKEAILECNKDFNHHLRVQKKWRQLDFKAKEAVVKEIKSLIEK